jgi:hypothetical protein
MIIDKLTEFSDTNLITATAISTNVYDLGASPTTRDIALGQTLWLVIQVDGVVTAAGAATVTFSIESDSTADLATSPTVHWTSAAIAKATLIAGYTVAVIALPSGQYERYLGVRYTVATGPLTGVSSFSAFLTRMPQVWKSTADGVA